MIKICPDQETKKVLVRISNLSKMNRRAIKNSLYEIGMENVRHVRKLIMSKNKHGRLYPFRGGLHRASAAGEAPANMTGALVRSVDYAVRGVHQMEFGDKVFYGKFLEDGTRKMAARPHLITTVNDKAKDAVVTFNRNFRKDMMK